MGRSVPVSRKADLSRVRRPGRLALCLALGVLLAGVSFASAVGQVLARKNPSAAMSLGLGTRAEARLIATYSDIALKRTTEKDPALKRAALAAIASGPLNPTAIQALALFHLARGEEARAAQLARLGERLSKREVGIQLLLFQDAVKRRQLGPALGHLDIALTTSGERQELFYPPLAQALQSPEMRQGLVGLGERRRAWLAPFLTYAVDEAGRAEEVADVLRRLSPAARSPLLPLLSERVLTRLVAADNYAAARSFAALLPAAAYRALGDAGINARTTDPRLGTLGWQLLENPNSVVQLESGRNASQRTLHVDLAAGEDAIVLRRVLFLAPGRYRFAARHVADDGSPPLNTDWSLRCVYATSSRPVWSQQQGGEPTVPSGCPQQLLELRFHSGAGEGGSFTITDLALTPVRG